MYRREFGLKSSFKRLREGGVKCKIFVRQKEAGQGKTNHARILPVSTYCIQKTNLEEVIPMAHTITDECINCGACEPVCPVEAISEQGDARVIDAATCTDCGACVDTCPVDAIKAP